jgi:hypothetical protein
MLNVFEINAITKKNGPMKKLNKALHSVEFLNNIDIAIIIKIDNVDSKFNILCPILLPKSLPPIKQVNNTAKASSAAAIIIIVGIYSLV